MKIKNKKYIKSILSKLQALIFYKKNVFKYLRSNVKGLAILALCFNMVACSTLVVSTTPEKMYKGKDRAPEEVSIIAGQSYQIAQTYWRNIKIREVDGKRVYNKWTDLKIKHIVMVLPGVHKLQFEVHLGRSTTHYYPVIVDNFKAGRAYQVHHRDEANEEATVKKGHSGLFGAFKESWYSSYQPEKLHLYIEEVGTVQEYLDYLKTDDGKNGKPMKSKINIK